MSDTKELTDMPLNRQLLRALIIAVVIIGGAILTYIVLDARDTRPNYYAPARTALVTAKERFEVAFGEESNLLNYLQETHRDLENAIAALEQARIDPELRHDIDTLRLRLRALEDMKRLQHTTPEQLKQSYHEIGAQIDALIAKLEKRNTAQ